MYKVKQGVTGDSDMQPLPMTEDDYKAMAYERYNCIDERSGRIEEIDAPIKEGDYVDFRGSIGVVSSIEGDMALVFFESRLDPLNVFIGVLKRASPKDLLANREESPGKTSKAEYYAFVEKTFADMLKLIKRKNADYCGTIDDPFANFRRAEQVGVDPINGLAVRFLDKVARIESFFQSGKLENESFEDAWLDVIGYACLALGMLKEKQNDK
jgi:hypothetical protein